MIQILLAQEATLSRSAPGATDNLIVSFADNTETVRIIGPTSIDDVSFERTDPNGAEDLLITVDDDNSVTIVGALGQDNANKIERFFFRASFYDPDDTRTEILAREATSGADMITGFQAKDTLGGGAGDDLLTGGAGGDTYDFSSVTAPILSLIKAATAISTGWFSMINCKEMLPSQACPATLTICASPLPVAMK